MNPVGLEDSVYLAFGTASPTTGAATNADSTPGVTVLEDGTALGYAPTVTNITTGLYKVQIDCTTANGFESGRRYMVYATATVAAITGRDGIGEFEVLGLDMDVGVNVFSFETGAIDSNSFLAGAITAAAIATDAIDADALAADAVTEIWAASTAPSAATIAGAVWNEDATGHQTLGTFGQAIGDPVADANTIFKAVVTDAAAATVGLDVVAIQADTDNIQTRLPAALVGGRMDSDVAVIQANAVNASALAADALTEIVNAVWDEPLTGATHNVASSSGKRLRQITSVLQTTGTVVDAGATTTSFKTDISNADNFWNDAQVVFTTGSLLGQARIITTFVSANGVCTFDEAWTSAPANGVEFTLYSIHTHTISQVADSVWDEDATGHQTLGTFGQAIGDPVADANTIFKAVVTDAAGATVGVDVVAVQADTDNIQTRLPAALVGGRMDSDVAVIEANVITAASIAADAITAAKIATNAIDADALAADAVTEIQAGLATSAALATVQADTDDIQTRLPAALSGGFMKSDVLAINTSAVAAQVLAILNGVTVVYQGTVTGAATTTTLIDTGLTQADTDWWKGRIIIFTSVITLQATDITGFDPATDKLTFTALTQAPTAATYVIL